MSGEEGIELGRSPTMMERLVHAGVKALQKIADNTAKSTKALGAVEKKVDDLAQQVAELNDTVKSKGS